MGAVFFKRRSSRLILTPRSPRPLSRIAAQRALKSGSDMPRMARRGRSVGRRQGHSPQPPFLGRADEGGGDLRDDRVAVGAQSHHSGGYPISQRECAGFNRPPFPIAAEQPVSISPEAVSRAGPGSVAAPGRRSTPCDGPPFGPSCRQGVGQPASATVLRLLSVLPASL